MSVTVSAIAYGTSEAGRAVLRKRSPGEWTGEGAARRRRWWEGERNDEPLGVEPAGELVNARGNYTGLAEITPRKIVIPP